MFPLMDGMEYGLLKERMTAMKLKAEQELDIGSRAQESGSVCDFFCSEITQNVSLFRFCFGIRNLRGRKRRRMVIDRRIRGWFCF